MRLHNVRDEEWYLASSGGHFYDICGDVEVLQKKLSQSKRDADIPAGGKFSRFEDEPLSNIYVNCPLAAWWAKRPSRTQRFIKVLRSLILVMGNHFDDEHTSTKEGGCLWRVLLLNR